MDMNNATAYAVLLCASQSVCRERLPSNSRPAKNVRKLQACVQLHSSDIARGNAGCCFFTLNTLKP